MTKFKVGDRVTIRDATTIFYTRAQSYVRGHTGVVVSHRPEWVIPEDEAWGRADGRKEPFYVTCSPMAPRHARRSGSTGAIRPAARGPC
jgi:hypothetical protein